MNKFRSERWVILILSIVVGVLVALQLKSVTNASKRVDLDGLQLADIRARLNEQIAKNEELDIRNQDLQKYIQEIGNQSSQTDAQRTYYLNEISRYQTFAGLTNVRGKGGIILVDPAGEVPVSDAELLVIINELRASGVEAISVNGQRVVAMTEIRSLGANGTEIQMNGERLSHENGYEIRVIGEPEKIRSAMDFLTELIARMRLDEKNVTANYPDSVEIPALATTSPVYRQGLLEVVPEAGQENP